MKISSNIDNYNYNFLNRYAKKCSIPASTFFENSLDQSVTFYDLSIPYRDKNTDHSSHFSNGDRQTSSRIKRYAMPMVIENTKSNEVCNP